MGTKIFDLVTLTLKFDLLLKNFNLGHSFLTRSGRGWVAWLMTKKNNQHNAIVRWNYLSATDNLDYACSPSEISQKMKKLDMIMGMKSQNLYDDIRYFFEYIVKLT